MMRAMIHLNYWKQGDDFANHLAEEQALPAALDSFIGRMEGVAKHLRAIKAKIGDSAGVSIDAGTHMICIEGPDALIAQLIADDLAASHYLDEDDDEYGDEYDER